MNPHSSAKRKLHFTGIGDPAMHDIAIALKLAGHEITGSDSRFEIHAQEKLQEFKLLPTKEGWFPERIDAGLDALIVSPAIQADNPELRRAKEVNIQIRSYPDFIYAECRDKHRVVVTGSYGKTMITLLILHVLNHHKRKFDYFVARQVPGLEHSVRLSDAPLVIIEGQDGATSPQDPTAIFLKYNHHIGVISGIEWQESSSHLTKEAYTKQFSQFELATPKGGVLIYFELEPVVAALSKQHQPDMLYIPYKTHASTYEGGQEFLLASSHEKYPLKLTGKHNLQNISAAKETLNKLGITSAMFYEAIQSFGGKTI